jgi:hypothetical protein
VDREILFCSNQKYNYFSFIIHRIDNDEFTSHAESVVQHYAKNEGIIQLEKKWRRHFLTRMKPKHLPPNWSIDHQECRLNSRAEELRITKEDLCVAMGQN